jgi:heme exporter protein B
VGSWLRQTLTIAAKDLRAEMRTKEALNASFAFSLVILVLFSFAFDPTSDEFKNFSGGLLWMTYSFAGALALNRSFARELQNDCLDGLVAAPLPGGVLFAGKALANYALLLAVEIVSLGVFAIFYNVKVIPQLGPLFGVILLATWAMTVIGTMFSALTVNLRMREMMLPIMTYPFLIPALMAAMVLTTDLLNGMPIGQDMIWVKLLVLFDVTFTTLAVFTIDIVLVG